MIVITLDYGSHLSYNLIDNRYAVRPCVYKKSKYQNNKYQFQNVKLVLQMISTLSEEDV